MRRKFINTNSLIFIILIAIFTLTSYVCDQGVIRQEDNIRKSDIKIDNLTTKVYDVNTISNQLLSLQDFIINSLVELNRDNLFWIKSLILLEKNSKVADTKMIDNVIDYDYIIEKTKNRFIYHYSEIIYNSLIASRIFNISHVHLYLSSSYSNCEKLLFNISMILSTFSSVVNVGAGAGAGADTGSDEDSESAIYNIKYIFFLSNLKII